jgi:hypothetical protein
MEASNSKDIRNSRDVSNGREGNNKDVEMIGLKLLQIYKVEVAQIFFRYTARKFRWHRKLSGKLLPSRRKLFAPLRVQ